MGIIALKPPFSIDTFVLEGRANWYFSRRFLCFENLVEMQQIVDFAAPRLWPFLTLNFFYGQ